MSPTGSMPLHGTPFVATTTGTGSVYTCPAGYRAHVTHVVLNLMTAVGGATGSVSAIGVFETGSQNFMTLAFPITAAVTPMTAALQGCDLLLASNGDVSIGLTGGAATTISCTVAGWIEKK